MSNRIKELDGVRGIAILMVLVWHYFTCNSSSAPPGSVLSYTLLSTSVLWSGVDLFFVLSGFLIGGIILDNHERKKFITTFWARRFFRIAPLYAILIFSFFILSYSLDTNQYSWLFNNPMPWWSYITFTQNIMMGLSSTHGAHYLGITWSLAVEEQFYLISPIIMMTIGKKWCVRSIIPFAICAFLLRLVFPGFHTHVNTLFRMDALLGGVTIAIVFRDAKLWQQIVRIRSYLLTLGIMLFIATGILVLTKGFGEIAYLWFSSLYCLYLLIILLFRNHIITSVFRSTILTFFGSIAYGLYMYHQAVLGLLHGSLRNGATPSIDDAYSALITFVSLLSSISIAFISFKYFETPILKLGNRFRFDN